MKNTFTESNSSFLGLFFISLTIVLISKLIFNILALGFIKQIWDLDTQVVFYDLENGIFNFIYAHKALALFDQVGTFLLPSVVIILFFKTLKPSIILPKKKDGLKLLLMFVQEELGLLKTYKIHHIHLLILLEIILSLVIF